MYYADACDRFAEHELDYILFAKVVDQEPSLERINRDEVQNEQWVSRAQLDAFLDQRLSKYGEEITPWFRLLKERKLDQWWHQLEQNDTFPDQAEHLEKFY